MDQGSCWQANNYSASQNITHNLRYQKCHFRVYKVPPPVPVLSQIDPLHAPHHISWKFTLILCSHLPLCLPSCLFPPMCPLLCLICTSLYTCHIPHPSNLLFCNHTDVWCEVKTVKFLTVQFSPFSSYFIPLIFKYLPQRHVQENTQTVFVT